MMWQDASGSGVIQLAANCLERHNSLSQATFSGKNVNYDQVRPRGRYVNCARFYQLVNLVSVPSGRNIGSLSSLITVEFVVGINQLGGDNMSLFTNAWQRWQDVDTLGF